MANYEAETKFLEDPWAKSVGILVSISNKLGPETSIFAQNKDKDPEVSAYWPQTKSQQCIETNYWHPFQIFC